MTRDAQQSAIHTALIEVLDTINQVSVVVTAFRSLHFPILACCCPTFAERQIRQQPNL